MKRLSTLAAVAPYATWMGLMMLLPTSAQSYAVRTAATLAVGLACWLAARAKSRAADSAGPGGSGEAERAAWPLRRALGVGVAVGLLVWALWVLPENFGWYRRFFIIGDVSSSAPSPYDPAVCGWPLTLVRLAGSAFVIAAVEEVFFRGWLYRWLGADASAFWWTVALFAIEHNRWLAGAAAGAIYGLCAIRCGLPAAIVAHVTTNLALGLQVVATGGWAFW